MREHLTDENDHLTIKTFIDNYEINLRIAPDDGNDSTRQLPNYDFFMDAIFYDTLTNQIKDPTYKGLEHLKKGVF